MAAKAVSADSSFLYFKEAAARQAHSKGYLTNLQSLVAFSHFPF
jgi:hypothetical protein